MVDTLIADAAHATAPAADAPIVPATPETPPVAAAPVVPDAPASKEVVVPEKYDLKLPDGSKLDATFVERTTAIARELGLSNEAGQKLLNQRVKEYDETVASLAPGGAVWKARDAEWTKQALADKALAPDGTQAALDTSLEKAQQLLTRFGDDDLRGLLKEYGWGSHPVVLRFLAKMGRAMGEGSLVSGTKGAPAVEKTAAQAMYPAHYDDEGKPKK